MHPYQDRLLEILEYLDDVEKNSTLPLSPPSEPPSAAGETDAIPVISSTLSHEPATGSGNVYDKPPRNPDKEALVVPCEPAEKENLVTCRSTSTAHSKTLNKWVWDTLGEELEEDVHEDHNSEWEDNDDMTDCSTTTTSKIKPEVSLSELSMMQQDVMAKIRAMKAELQVRSDEAEELEETLLRKRATYEKARKSVDQVSPVMLIIHLYF